MNLNGVSSYSQVDAYSAYQNVQKAVTEEPANSKDETGVIAEFSAEGTAAAKKYTTDLSIVEMLKADQESYQQKLMSYVQESILGQGNAIATTDDMWKFLASGNFTVTEEAKAEAKAALEEGGYWSVDKTADRIMEMAKALTGGDPSKIELMKDAFKKGFEEATKTWGKELPEISSKTYDKVMEKFDAWAAESATPEI